MTGDVIIRTHCCYCRRAFISGHKFLSKTKEHFIPLSRSGYNYKENILDACNECNRWKGSIMPKDFLKIVRKHFDLKRSRGSYTVRDYAQMIGSLLYWIKLFKGNAISDYKF